MDREEIIRRVVLLDQDQLQQLQRLLDQLECHPEKRKPVQGQDQEES